MNEFIVWWRDEIQMSFVVEAYGRVCDAFSRVAELRKLEIEVLPVVRHTIGE